jgi:hypothetical protein
MFVSFPPCIGTSAFPTTFQHEGNIAHTSFPSNTSTSTFPKTTLHYEGKLAHDSFHSSTSTNAFPTKTFHRE